MKIVSQKGIAYDVYELQMHNREIRGRLYNPKNVEILGTYSSRQRACEVYSEIACCSWNKESDSYTMPSE